MTTVENEVVARVLRLTGGKYRFLKDIPRDEWTDEHEAELERQILDDPDEGSLPTDEEIAQAKPFAEVFPDLAASIRRGRPKLDNPKKLVSIRLDADVIMKFKSTGAGWQSRINAALRAASPSPAGKPAVALKRAASTGKFGAAKTPAAKAAAKPVVGKSVGATKSPAAKAAAKRG